MAHGPPGPAGSGKAAGLASEANSSRLAGQDDHLLWGAYLQGLSRIRGTLVHDLRSRLNGLVLHVELLGELARRDEMDPTETRARLRRYGEAMREEIRHLESGAEAMLRQLQAGSEPEAVPAADLGETLREVETMLSTYARHRRVRCAWTPPVGRVEITGDPVARRQALFLLVQRALEAIPESGALEVRGEAAAGEAVLTLAAAGRGAAVVLGAAADSSNAGAPTEDVALAAVRRVVEAAGGRLLLPGEPGFPLQVRWPRLETH